MLKNEVAGVNRAAAEPSNWQLQSAVGVAFEEMRKSQAGLLTAARGVDTKDLDEASSQISVEASRICLSPMRAPSPLSPADFSAQVLLLLSSHITFTG